MAVLDAVTDQRVLDAIERLSRRCRLRAAYLFGSRADGTADAFSDVDIAVFIEGLEDWDFEKRIQVIVELQAERGDDLEFHFFPTESLTNPPRASFAEFILRHGVLIRSNDP
jgi:predicted nucleotidyltransferase